MPHTYAEAPGSRPPSLLDWLLVAPLLLLASVIAAGYVVLGLMRGAR